MKKQVKPRLWLKKYREQRGIGLIEAADLCGLSKGHYYKIESGQTARPSFETARKIAYGLGFSIQRFYQIEENEDEN
jgi:transcriptional regulator with XRE-family HTH domain